MGTSRGIPLAMPARKPRRAAARGHATPCLLATPEPPRLPAAPVLDRPLVTRLPKGLKVAVHLDAIDQGMTVQRYVTAALQEHLARVRPKRLT